MKSVPNTLDSYIQLSTVNTKLQPRIWELGCFLYWNSITFNHTVVQWKAFKQERGLSVFDPDEFGISPCSGLWGYDWIILVFFKVRVTEQRDRRSSLYSLVLSPDGCTVPSPRRNNRFVTKCDGQSSGHSPLSGRGSVFHLQPSHFPLPHISPVNTTLR